MGLTKTKIARESYTVSTILEAFNQGILRDDHPQQRHANQHNNVYRDSFIATVIKNEDFDSIKTCEQNFNSSTVLWLIDGLQRVSEIREYRNGLFKLGRSIEQPIIDYQIPKKNDEGIEIKDEEGNPIYETIQLDLRGKYYNDLPKTIQLQFDSCPVDVIKHLNCTSDDIAYHMRRYNRQAAMNGAQICVTYAEKFAKQIRDMAINNRFFLDCGNYTSNDFKRGIIERVIMESDMSIFHLEDWKKRTNLMGQYINMNASKDEFDIINKYFERLYPIAEGKFQDIFNTKNTFVFMALFHRFTKLNLPDESFGEFLDAFSQTLYREKFGDISFEELDESRNTKDKTLIIKKVDLLNSLMSQFFGIIEHQSLMPDDVNFVADKIGYTCEELAPNMKFYYQCLDDTLDRFVPQGSILWDENARLPLVTMLIYCYDREIDFETWLNKYVNLDIKLISPVNDYENMVQSLDVLDIPKAS